MEEKQREGFIKRHYGMPGREFIFMLCAIFVFAGIFGFIYETFFYRIDLGYFTKRGTTFGPWIPIYGYGGLLITLIVWHFKKHPAAVFVMSGLVCGLLEFITGYLLYQYAGGLRLWDYNSEIWNWGNIGGYVCARSVLLFAASGLFLIYVCIPLFKRMYNANRTLFRVLSVVLCALFVLDIIVSDLVR